MPAGFSIANMFRTGNNAQPVQVSGATAPQPGAGAKPATGNLNDVRPNPSADLETVVGDPNLGDDGLPKKSSSPLDDFSDIFKVDDKKQAPVDPLAEKLFNFDPKKLMESVGKMNFAQGITPEVMQKIQSGDVAALTGVLNGTGQTAFASAIQMLIPVMEQSIAKNNQRFKSILASEVRKVQINQGKPDNAALQHEAAQPVLAAIKAQISSQFPDMDPSEVTKKAEDYFLAMAKAVTSSLPEDKNADGTTKSKGPKEPDYSAFLEIA